MGRTTGKLKTHKTLLSNSNIQKDLVKGYIVHYILQILLKSTRVSLLIRFRVLGTRTVMLPRNSETGLRSVNWFKVSEPVLRTGSQDEPMVPFWI